MTSLDPEDWSELRALGHRMVDDMIDYLADVRERPVWQKMPAPLRAELKTPLPHGPQDAASAYADFQRLVQPYATGNTHPRFMGWVHGGGNAVGMLGDLLAGGLNANLGGRDHAPVEVERQVIAWTAEMLGFPEGSSGSIVTGSSIANFIGVLVARQRALGPTMRRDGIGGARLVAYSSSGAHSCVPRALEMAGIGSAALRSIATDDAGRIDVAALAEAIARDRRNGFTPFLVVGTAGTVDIGAIDDLAALAELCRREQVWFHVDGAFGALGLLAPRLKPLLRGIEQADSVALDYHKWGQVPYDAGCIIVRDAALHAATFALPAPYLAREERGLAGNHPWPCDFGPELSRGFRALKIWLTLKVHGADRLGVAIQNTCDMAQILAARIGAEPELELLAPVALNIVCFRYRAGGDVDGLNREIVADLQEDGVAAPSTTVIGGQLAIRAALVNHRIREDDVHALVDNVLARGRARAALDGSGRAG